MMQPNRGDIWLVDLDPTRGQEIQKTRPVVIISTDLFAPIPLRIIIPITTWQDKFDRRPFMVKLPATETNGLARDSAANVLQIRSLSTDCGSMRQLAARKRQKRAAQRSGCA